MRRISAPPVRVSGRNIRLLQIAKYFLPDQGGIETVTHSISHALLEHSIQADVLCFSRRSSYPELDCGFRVVRAKTLLEVGNQSLSMDYVQQLRRLQSRYDIALLHMPNPIGMLGMLAFWRKPFIVLWHADSVSYPLLGKVFRGPERLLVKRAARVLVPTPAHAEGSLVASDMKDKTVIAPFPFSRDLRFGNRIDEHGLARLTEFCRGRKLVLFVGRLVHYKGLDVLVKSALQLNDGMCIAIIGDGPLREPLDTLVGDLKLADRVLLFGPASDQELRQAYESAYIFALPSVTRAEMYGLSLVEAMSFGKPLVSTTLAKSGVSFVNTHGVTGLTVIPGDAAALADALNAIHASPGLYAKLSAGAAATFDRRFDLLESGGTYARAVREAVQVGPTYT